MKTIMFLLLAALSRAVTLTASLDPASQDGHLFGTITASGDLFTGCLFWGQDQAYVQIYALSESGLPGRPREVYLYGVAGYGEVLSPSTSSGGLFSAGVPASFSASTVYTPTGWWNCPLVWDGYQMSGTGAFDIHYPTVPDKPMTGALLALSVGVLVFARYVERKLS